MYSVKWVTLNLWSSVGLETASEGSKKIHPPAVGWSRAFYRRLSTSDLYRLWVLARHDRAFSIMVCSFVVQL